MKIKDIKQQLNDMGISEAIASTGTVDGSLAAFLRWNGDEEYYTGADLPEGWHPDLQIASERLAKFKDENLDFEAL